MISNLTPLQKEKVPIQIMKASSSNSRKSNRHIILLHSTTIRRIVLIAAFLKAIWIQYLLMVYLPSEIDLSVSSCK